VCLLYWSNIKILVCIPAFKQAKTIDDIIIKSKKHADEIIVYGDGFIDNTYEVANSAGATNLGIYLETLLGFSKYEYHILPVTLRRLDNLYGLGS